MCSDAEADSPGTPEEWVEVDILLIEALQHQSAMEMGRISLQVEPGQQHTGTAAVMDTCVLTEQFFILIIYGRAAIPASTGSCSVQAVFSLFNPPEERS